MSHPPVAESSTYHPKKVRMSSYDFDRDLDFWQLPKPLKGKEREWHVIARSTQKVPFGYREHPDNFHLFEPVVKELEALELAKRHLKQYSYKAVAAWLTKETGRSITPDGLRKRIEVERRRKRASAIKRKLAARLQETLDQIEKLEKGRVGAYSVREQE